MAQDRIFRLDCFSIRLGPDERSKVGFGKMPVKPPEKIARPSVPHRRSRAAARVDSARCEILRRAIEYLEKYGAGQAERKQNHPQRDFRDGATAEPASPQDQ
jgi:hypothetical protein